MYSFPLGKSINRELPLVSKGLKKMKGCWILVCRAATNRDLTQGPASRIWYLFLPVY